MFSRENDTKGSRVTHEDEQRGSRLLRASTREELSRFDERLRRVSTVLFGAGMLAVLLVANSGLVLPNLVHQTALNWVVVAAGVSVAGVLLFPWRRYARNLFLVTVLDGLCLITLAIYFSGGWGSPFFPFYFFVVVFCALYFPPRMAALAVFLTVLLSLSPQLYAPDVLQLVEHTMVWVPTYLALALVSSYMAREVGRRERLQGEYQHRLRRMRELKDSYQHAAVTDPLTGLYNRALLMDRLKQALSRARRQSAKVAVLFVDLDNFKVVNDSLGHEVGDRLLVAVAERLRACLRPEDTAARLGGDEFVVLLEDIESVEDARRVAERIIEGVARVPFDLGTREVFAGPSIGIAVSGFAHDTPESLLREADIAMYRVKEDGKAGYRVFERSMHAETLKRLELENDLRQALERGELRVCYQPLVLLETGRIVGFEALARWEHPARGSIRPSEFIPLAEEAGLIVALGRHVIQEACWQAQKWQERQSSGPPFKMNVNISLRQFQQPSFFEEVVAVLSKTKLNPNNLVLEITESVAMDDAKGFFEILRRFNALGVRLALDDFGTGYSSLMYLTSKRFRLDFVKVAGPFTRELLEDSKNELLLSGILRIAHSLDLGVIAEEVETAEQLARLRELGCDMAQGNYFSEPVPAEVASELPMTYISK